MHRNLSGRLSLCSLILAGLAPVVHAAGPTAITDHTSYNAGSSVRIRLGEGGSATASLRYAGEQTPLGPAIPIKGGDYQPLWTVPWNARTGRYEVDLTSSAGPVIRNATSFAVHRQLAEISTIELDKTFYTSGDPVNPRIVVRNLSNQPLQNLRVEFEAYNYPWIAQMPDEAPMWRTIIADSLSLPAGGEKEFRAEKSAVVQAGNEPVVIYFSVVIRDGRQPDRIYDLAFAPPAFTVPANTPLPAAYPFLYLYSHLSDLPKSEAYRQFYPPEFVSGAITFNTEHTMFATGDRPAFEFTVHSPAASVRARVLDADGKVIHREDVPGPIPGEHRFTLDPEPAGLYTLEVSLRNADGSATASNRIEFAVNPLPKSILIFCAHEDDDTADPGIIRAAVENHIPIHFVYFTSGDAGGCDRFFMHSCDAARAMAFGEVRMAEARGSLGHLGVPAGNISFLGLPDGGLEQIWYDHRSASDPYLSVLLASDHAPYRDLAQPNLPFARDSVEAVVREAITRFQPDEILTGHPDERHVDHRTNNWLVVKAMQDLLSERKISRDTKLLVDVAYGAMPGRHAPYRFEKNTFHVSGEAARRGQEALWYYQSQDGNHQQANLVGYSKLSREESFPHFQILDWPDHAGWNEGRPVQ